MAFTESLDGRALRVAAWAFPLFLLLLNLAVMPLLWSGNGALPGREPRQPRAGPGAGERTAAGRGPRLHRRHLRGEQHAHRRHAGAGGDVPQPPGPARAPTSRAPATSTPGCSGRGGRSSSRCSRWATPSAGCWPRARGWWRSASSPSWRWPRCCPGCWRCSSGAGRPGSGFLVGLSAGVGVWAMTLFFPLLAHGTAPAGGVRPGLGVRHPAGDGALERIDLLVALPQRAALRGRVAAHAGHRPGGGGGGGLHPRRRARPVDGRAVVGARSSRRGWRRCSARTWRRPSSPRRSPTWTWCRESVARPSSAGCGSGSCATSPA